MTNFDNLLRQAYDAGYHARVVDHAPDFEEWRANLSGLDVGGLVDDEIRVGDIIEITSPNRAFDEVRGSHQRVTWADDLFLNFEFGGEPWTIWRSGVRKVVPGQ